MAAMRRIAAVAATRARRTLGRPLNLLWILAIPLFFAVPVAYLFAQVGEVPRLPVVVEDRGPWVEPLLAALRETPMEVELLDRADAERRLETGRERVALLVPEGFSDSVQAGRPHLVLLHGPRYEPGLEADRVRTVAAALVTGRPAKALPVAAEAPRAAADPERYPFLRAVFGFYAMFAFSTLMSQAASLHAERRLGTLSRTLLLGVPYAEVVAGHALAMFLIGLVQTAVILGVTGVLGAPWLAAGVPALALAVLATLLAACGWSLGLAGLTRTPEQVNFGAVLVSVVAAMLGGAFWPLEVVPASLQQVARLSPVYWALDAVREAWAFGGPGAGQLQPAAVLLLMGLLGGMVGVLGLRRWAA